MAGLNTEGLSGDALKRAQAYNAALEKSQKTLEKQQKIVGEISQAFLGISGNEFFRNLTNEEYQAKLQKLNEVAKSLQQDARDASDELDNAFLSITKNLGITLDDSSELADKLGLSSVEADKLAEAFKKSAADGVSISTIIKDMGEYGGDLVDKIQQLDLPANLVEPFNDAFDKAMDLDTQLEQVNDQLANAQETVFDLGAGFSAIGKNLTKSFSITSLKASLLEYDKITKNLQIQKGIVVTNNQRMAELTSNAAKFGMNTEETAQLMGDLSTELRTTNFDVLADATEDLAAMQKATGLASGDTAKLTKEFVKFGRSTKDMVKMSEDVMASAASYGLSGKDTMEEMAKGMSKMRQMGFTGGEQSLKKMVLESKRLGMSVDEIFDTAKRARSIEGAMEMAAELQLAGGSFAAIDPMQLLSAARKGPAELQKILGQMGADVGHFNEETRAYEFDPVDVDRLQMVADATGQSLDSLQNMIAQNAQDNQKLDLLPPSLLGSISDEEKAFLMQATQVGKDGTIDFTAGFEDLGDLKNLTQEELAAKMKARQEEKADLEKMAKENMTFQESLNALKESFINSLLPVLQPLLEWAKSLIQAFNEFTPGQKQLIAGVLALGSIIGGALFSAAKWFLQGIQLSKGFQMGMSGGGFFDKVKGLFGKGGGAAGTVGGVTGGGAPTAPQAGANPVQGGWIASMAAGLKAFSTVGYKDIVKFGFALLTIGAAVIIFMAGLAATGSPDGSQLIGAAVSIGILAGGLWLASKIMGKISPKDIMMGALAMGVMGLALVPFAYAAQIMSGVDWLNVLAGVGVAALVVLGLMALGLLAVPGLILIAMASAMLLMGGLALLGFGLMMGVAGPMIMSALPTLQAITETDWSGLAMFGVALTALGVGLLVAGVGFVAGVALIATGMPAFSLMVPLFVSLAQQDWSGLITLATGMFAMAPAMIAFGLAAMFFANPLTLIGLYFMSSTLSELQGIMTTLAPNMVLGAQGTHAMADGIAKLNDSVSELDIDKLWELQEVLEEAADNGMAEFVAAVQKMTMESTVNHVVELKLDGKTIQEIILRDTKHTS